MKHQPRGLCRYCNKGMVVVQGTWRHIYAERIGNAMGCPFSPVSVEVTCCYSRTHELGGIALPWIGRTDPAASRGVDD